MKKIGMLVILFVSVLFISGCGNKKLVCTMTETDITFNATINRTLIIEFGLTNNVKKVTEENVMEFKNKLNADILYSTLEEQIAEKNGEITREGNTIKASATSKVGFGKIGKTYKEAKEYFEIKGYTCE